jgi:Holliday junction DNA helicase RuvA
VIAHLSGTLLEKGLDSAVVSVGGVGLQVGIPISTLQALPAVGQPVQLYTYLKVAEDSLSLYGFATAEERQSFTLCLSVSGIGPKLALATLSGLGAALPEVIAAGDVARLTRVPGIGKKTAERLVVELKDKFRGFRKAGSPRSSGSGTSDGSGANSRAFDDVATALQNLGYRAVDAERATTKALEAQAGAPVEEILRSALRSLQRD